MSNTEFRVDILHHNELRFDDGSVENFRVRVFRRPEGKPEEIANTGWGFETKNQAQTYAEAVLNGITTVTGNSRVAATFTKETGVIYRSFNW